MTTYYATKPIVHLGIDTGAEVVLNDKQAVFWLADGSLSREPVVKKEPVKTTKKDAKNDQSND